MSLAREERTDLALPDAEGRPADSVRPVPVPDAGRNVVDLRYLMREVWRWKWLIAIFTAGGLYVGVGNMRSFEPRFVVEAIISSAESAEAAPTGSLNALASSLGIRSGGQQQTTSIDRIKLTLGSTQFATAMDEKYGWMRLIYRNAWHPETGAVQVPTGTRFEYEQRVRAFLHLPTWSPPNIESLARHTAGGIGISQVGATQFYRVHYEHPDPEFGLRFVSSMLSEADTWIRDRERDDIDERRSYLLRQMGTETRNDLRSALTSLLQQNEARRMMMEVGGGYSVKFLEPAHVLAQKTSPNITSDLMFPTFLGFLMGLGLVTIIALWRIE